VIKYAVAIAAVVGICSAIPAAAEEVGIGVGPHGVTVGESHGDRDRDRDREHYRDRTAEIVTKRLLSGGIVTTTGIETTTVVRLLSTAIDQ